jgi:hypothetical protein
MAEDIEPLARQAADIERKIRRRVRDLVWLAVKRFGKELPRILLLGTSGSAGLVWAVIGLHEAAYLVIALVLIGAFVALAGYTLGLRKQLVDERAMRRWAFVAGKRMEQEVLKRELALDLATLILVNDPKDRATANRLSAPRSPEFASAVRYVRGRLRIAASAASDRPQPRKAAVHGHATPRAPTAQEMLRDGGRVPRAPVPPDLAVVRRRRDLRTSKIAKLEAEIQALAAPDLIELAFAAEEAATSYKDQRAAAHLADRVARDRQRAGRKPTAPDPDGSFVVSFHPNGNRDVRQTRTLTPEQIARGEQPADGTP